MTQNLVAIADVDVTTPNPVCIKTEPQDDGVVPAKKVQLLRNFVVTCIATRLYIYTYDM